MCLLPFMLYRTMVSSSSLRERYPLVNSMGKVPFPFVALCGALVIFLFNSLHRMFILLDSKDFRSHESIGMPVWLGWLCLGAAPASLVTFIVALWHIGEHLWAGSTKMKRQRVLQVLILPMVYSCMSLQSVALVCEFLSSTESRSVHGTKHLGDEYEANFNIADFYEAYVLNIFCRLVMDEIQSWHRGRRADQCVSDEQESEQELVLHSLTAVTTQGVKTYVWTSGLYALYSVVTTWFEVLPADSPSMLAMPNYLFGAGFLASCIAISNVVQIEVTFHKQLKGFRCTSKFWSVKVLVSISFVQKIAISIASSAGLLRDERLGQLLYAAIICYELLLITLLHLRAWRVDEEWMERIKLKATNNCGNSLSGALLTN